MLRYQISNVYQVKPHFPDIFTLWNILTIIIALPILNFIILPCIPSSTMRERIGFGVSFIALSAMISVYLEWCVLPNASHQHQFLWLLLPTVCVSLGEMMLFVTGDVNVCI